MLLFRDSHYNVAWFYSAIYNAAFAAQIGVDIGGLEVSPDGSIKIFDKSVMAFKSHPQDEFEKWESRL